MKKLLFLLYLIIGNTGAALAVPAYTQKVKIAVEDGYIYIHLQGDENLKYGHTEEGYTILKDGNEWYYACTNNNGQTVCSSHKLMRTKSAETTEFLKKTPKGLVPQANITSINRSSTIVSGSRMATGNNSIIGERKILVILMQFADRAFTKTKEDFNTLFNQENYNEDGAQGSVRDFYHQSSYKQLTLQSDIIGPFTTKYNMAYYGGNSSVGGDDQRPAQMFEEAIEKAAQSIDLTQYDNNRDGYIDGVHIIYAGYGEEAGASADAIWAHEMQFNPRQIKGLYIDRYSCSPELRDNKGKGITRIGVICHEIAHSLGAMDYYDTNYSTDGQYEGTGKWDIMAQGSWNNNGITPADFNPYIKAYNFGWVNVETLYDGENTIAPTLSSNTVYRIDTPVNGEFFLLENKNSQHLPGNGLLIYHINSNIEEKATTNKINASYPQACYPVCASSSYKQPSYPALTYGDINSAGCPYPGNTNNTSFTPSSTPAAVCTNGSNTEISITNITHKADGSITLNYKTPVENDNPATNESNNLLWNDDFEEFTFKENWDVETINNNSLWNIVKYISPDTKFPHPYSGYGLLTLQSGRTTSLIKERTKSRIALNDIIELSTQHKTQFKLHCAINSAGNIADTITVYMREVGEEAWNCVKTQELNKANEWFETSFEIESKYNKIELALEACIDYNTILYLDAMSIEELKGATNKEKITSGVREYIKISRNGKNNIRIQNIEPQATHIKIYGASGNIIVQKILEGNETACFELKKGLYLLRHNHGSAKIHVH